MSRLSISLFGDVRITHDDVRITTNVTRTTQALLAYLLLLPHRPQPRDVLADVFWGDRGQDKARNCLNTALWRLRRVLEADDVPPGTYLITAPNGDVGFNWESDHWLDLAAFEQAVTRVLAIPIDQLRPEDSQRLEEALALQTGELLEGFYDDWALRERERLRHAYLNGHAYLMRAYQHTGQFERGLEHGRRILDIDPLREEIHRAMMQLYIANGQRALAARQYEQCCTLLNAELGIPPMDETQVLSVQLGLTSTRSNREPRLGQELPNLQTGLYQLKATLHTVERIHDQLQQAIQFIERVIDRHDTRL